VGNERLDQLPLGLKINKLQEVRALPVQFSGSYQYNFADRQVAPARSVGVAVKFLFTL